MQITYYKLPILQLLAISWMCGVKLKDRLPSKELRERLGVDISDTARDLGVVIDRELSLAAHVTAVCRSSYNQLRQLRPVVRS